MVAHGAPATLATTPSDPRGVARRVPRRSAVVDQQRHMAQEQRAVPLERFALVKRLQTAGWNAEAIMRETGIGRSSVRKWLPLTELPTRSEMAPRAGMPAFYREYLQRRWTEGCQSGRRLMAEIQTLGYVGGYAGLAKLLAPWRDAAPGRCEPSIVPLMSAEEPSTFVPVRHVSPQIAAALLGQPRGLLSARQAETVDAFKAHCPTFTLMRGLVLSFRTILRVGHVPTLHRWLDRAQDAHIHTLQRFVRKLRHDLSAVEGAVVEPWSNGPVEGHINRLKTLKRQMYGRAGVALLRTRLLPLPPLVIR